MPWRTRRCRWPSCALALGILFGAAEVTTVAFADEQGAQGWAGVLLALWALGSLLAGLVTGAITWRTRPGVRVPLGCPRHGVRDGAAATSSARCR